MGPDQSRLAILQRRRIRKARAPKIVAAWARAGVAASVLSDARHNEFVEKFRGSGTRSPAVGSLQSILEELAAGGDMVLIVGWDIDYEPALLIRNDALAGSGVSLQTLYCDGFVAADQPATRALIIDFDEHDFHADEVRLRPSG